MGNTINVGVRGNWIKENLAILFGPGGILSMFERTHIRSFTSAFKTAENKARDLLAAGSHSAGQNGDEGENFPPWVTLFLEYFD